MGTHWAPPEELGERVEHVIHLIRLHLRIHRETDDLLCGCLGHGERAVRKLKVPVGLLLMERQWIVEPSCNPAPLQELAHPVALGHPNHKEVIHRPSAWRLSNDSHLRRFRQMFPIPRRDGSPSLIPLVEAPQLDAKESSLKGV